jgi:hypothetical protein
MYHVVLLATPISSDLVQPNFQLLIIDICYRLFINRAWTQVRFSPSDLIYPVGSRVRTLSDLAKRILKDGCQDPSSYLGTLKM